MTGSDAHASSDDVTLKVKTSFTPFAISIIDVGGFSDWILKTIIHINI